ncbi:MerR family transcriptional regulator [Halobacillus faecis]
MEFKIGQAAKVLGISTYTLRYYEKEGLIPSVKRSQKGTRVYDESDLYWIDMIRCYRDTGMTLKDIKQMIELSHEGDHTLDLQKDILNDHKTKVEKQIEDLQEHLHKMNQKIKWYDGEIATCPFSIHIHP